MRSRHPAIVTTRSSMAALNRFVEAGAILIFILVARRRLPLHTQSLSSSRKPLQPSRTQKRRKKIEKREREKRERERERERAGDGAGRALKRKEREKKKKNRRRERRRREEKK